MCGDVNWFRVLTRAFLAGNGLLRPLPLLPLLEQEEDDE
jgi:hypothetical protein